MDASRVQHSIVFILLTLLLLLSFVQVLEAQKQKQQEQDESQLNELLGEINFDRVNEPLPNRISAFIDVVLIGFQGDGREKIKLDLNDVLNHLDAIKMSNHVHIVSTSASDAAHLINVHVDVKYRVKHASSSVLEQIKKTLGEYLSKKTGTETAVPYDLVDEIIRLEHDKHSESYGIFIINTPVLKEGMLYWYSGYPSSSNQIGQDCGTSLWIGDGRHIWMDLTSGPLSFGPINGDGVVTIGAIPRVENFKSSKEFRNKDFSASLGAFVSKITEHVIIPPIFHPKLSDGQLTIPLIHVTDKGNAAPPIRIEDLSDSLRNLHYGSYLLKIELKTLTQDQMNNALLAYKNSVKIKGEGLKNEHYDFEIDSQELRINLQSTFLISEISVGNMGRVLPVFLFDLKDDIPMKESSSVSFPDMVIAVQSTKSHFMRQFVCRGRNMDEFMPAETKTLYRPVLASILTSAWGITPSYQTWSSSSGSIVNDYIFAVGFTPFGPFSVSKYVSYAIRDSIPRFLCLMYLNRTIQEVDDFYERLKSYNLTVEEAFTENELLDFYLKKETTRRKLDLGLTSLSSHSHKFAVHFFRSMRSELGSVRYLLSQATAKIITRLNCGEEEEIETDLYYGTIEFALTLGAVYLCARMIKISDLPSLFTKKNKAKKQN